MAGPRITPDEEEAILATLRETENVRETARRHKRSPASVSTIAKRRGVDVVERSQTKDATAALAADNDARFELLVHRMVEEGHRALDEMHRPRTYWNFGGSENSYNEHTMPEPTIADQRSLMVMAAVAVDKRIAARRAERGDEGEGVALIEALGAGIRAMVAAAGDAA